MNYLKTLVLSILANSLLAGHSNAQVTVDAAGGDVSSSSGSYSQSVGQAFYSFQESSEANVSEGVQQPFEVSVDTSTLVLGASAPQTIIEGTTLKIYPNPLSQDLFIESDIDQKCTLEILSPQGKKLKSIECEAGKCKVSFKNYPTGMYLVRIVDENTNKPHIFKIIKTD